VGVCVYGFGDWVRLFGGDVEAYRDCLIEQARFVAAERSRGRRVVKVPFVEPEFGAWLASRAGVEPGLEAHGEWAVEVASDPDALRRVRAAVPALPAAPEEEEFVDVVRAVLLPVIVESRSEAERLSHVFPADACREASREFAGALGRPRLVRLSRLRAEGAALVPGSRFVAPGDTEEVADGLEGMVRDRFRIGEDEVAVAPVPRRYRVEVSRKGSAVLVVCALPVVLCGARWEVERADARLLAGEGSEWISAGLRVLVESLGVPWRTEGYEPAYVPPCDAEDLAGDLLEAVETAFSARPGSGGPALRRLK
jgi:hypothetical protein